MDYEYLQNVLGSPYVNEGAFDRLKAKGAQAMGSLGAMAGYQIQNPTETKLKSLWEGFVSSLERVMNDWKTQVSPMLGADVNLDAASRQIKKNLDALAQVLTPYEVGAYHSTVKPNPSALKTLTKEGLWDATKRSMGLNKALASNNPGVITNSYKNHVLSLFQNFMKDAIKSTGLAAQQVYKTLAKMQPSEKGWQAAGNMQKVVKTLQRLQGPSRIPPVIQPQPPAATPPSPSVPSVASPPPSPTPAATATATPPPLPPQSSPSEPQPSVGTPPPLPTTASPKPQQSGMVSGEGFEISAQDMPYVILKALSIIVDAAKSDEDHALGLFGVDPYTKTHSAKPPLATTWGSGPALTSSLQEVLHPPKSNKPVPQPEEPGYLSPEAEAEKQKNDEIKFKEFPKEFLYNFHSRYAKQPGAPFSIQVEPVNVSPEIKEIGASVDVWWHNQGGLNKIYVTETKQGKRSKATLIAKFYDHEVSAKMGASTAGNINAFSIDKIVQNSNPSVASKLAGAPKDVMNQIHAMHDDVLRALMAVTQRKRMEFKSKGWAEKKEQETGTVNQDGSFSYVDAETGAKSTLSQNQLIQILKGPLEMARKFRDMLNAVGYDSLFPNVLPLPPEKTEVWKAAFEKLKSEGYTDKKATNTISDAWFQIKEKNPSASIWDDATITADDLVPQTETPEEILVKGIPEAMDAVQALIKLDTTPKSKKSDGQKTRDAVNAIAKAVKAIGKDKTSEDYLNAVLKKPKATKPAEPAAAAPTAPSAPAEPPKFKVGDTVDAANMTVKIKFIGKDNVVISDKKGTEYSIPIAQWTEWEKTGGVKQAKPVSGAASGPAPTAPVSAPASGPEPTKSPTAPVSNAGAEKATQSKAPQTQDLGKLSIEGDKLVWTVGNDTQKLSADQVKSMLKKKKFKDAVKAHADVYQKFKDSIDKGGKPTTSEGIERINPFRWENFV